MKFGEAMKKLIVFIGTICLLFSCTNQLTDFGDFDHTSVYFSFQYPVRTLVMGEYILPNDENLEFKVGVQMGGVYENESGRTVELQVDESLAQDFVTLSGDTLEPLPTNYYSFPNGPDDVTNSFEVEIPAGELNGYIDVKLDEAFLDDTLSHQLHYVLPVRINSSSLDSILVGQPAEGVTSPSLTNPDDWEVSPKNYVLYAVKYINRLDGNYLHRGRDIVEDLSGTPIDTVVYRTPFIIDNEIWKLSTLGRYQVEVSGQLSRNNAPNPGPFTMLLTFDDQNNISISEANNSAFQITGSGNYVPDGDEFGGKERDAIIIDYEVETTNTVHNRQDTLVLRDRGVDFETFSPIVN